MQTYRQRKSFIPAMSSHQAPTTGPICCCVTPASKDDNETKNEPNTTGTNETLPTNKNTEHYEIASDDEANKQPKDNSTDIPMEVPNWSCHTQSIERVVKMVTEASEKYYSHEKRDGAIRAKEHSRRLMSKNESKQDLLSLI